MRSGRLNPYAFLAFPLAVVFVFTLLPTVAGLALSLFAWDGAGPARFVGDENFRRLLEDAWFRASLRNTLVFVVGTVPPTVLAGFLLAATVHARWFVGQTAVRTMLFLPAIV